MCEPYAVETRSISKTYKLYSQPMDRLKESLKLTKKMLHRDFFALRDISLDVKKGETLGIVGKNGSGKSTLLKIITGVLTPSSGQVITHGRISALLELGAGFNSEMTGRENLYLNGSMMGYTRDEIEQKVPNILEFADIGDYVDQPVKTYSSGMFTRLAFALAIHVDPDILIVDEALAVGDMAFQMKCYKKFNDFKAAGKTILFVSHSLDSILRYCDKVVVLHEGSVIAHGPVKEMVDIYKRLLVNSYPVNNQDLEDPDNSVADHPDNTELWKTQFTVNPDMLVYGDDSAEIIDYAMFDSNNRIVTDLISGETISFRMKVRFRMPIKEPLFAFTIKDIWGNEIAGTNTMIEMIPMGSFQPGEDVTVRFTQELCLKSGGYAVSFGCVHYKGEELIVCQRVYDAILFEVHSVKQIIGIFDVRSNISIQRQKNF